MIIEAQDSRIGLNTNDFNFVNSNIEKRNSAFTTFLILEKRQEAIAIQVIKLSFLNMHKGFSEYQK